MKGSTTSLTHWNRIKELFHVAVDLPPSKQSVFLKEQCSADPQLVPEVLQMCAADRQAREIGFLNTSALELWRRNQKLCKA